MFLISLTSISISKAQLKIRREPNMGKLVRNVLVGQGITVRNIIYKGDTGAIAIFDGTNSNLGLDSGVLISTGKAIDAIGPNNLQVSSSNNKGGDIDLNTIAGGITVDAASLQFDFIPVTNSIKLRFVFASEEYPEFVGQSYNDAFGFFVSGPGIVGKKNIAVVPGTLDTPIAINSINAFNNSGLYVDNANGLSIQYDAFTKVIEVSFQNLTACQTYTIKLAISDVIDRAYDSGIFLEAQSFESENIDNMRVEIVHPTGGTITEKCDSVVCRFSRTNTDTSSALLGSYGTNTSLLAGIATMGDDYPILSGNITIPKGQFSTDLYFFPIDDNLVEAAEKFKIEMISNGGCFISADSLNITDFDTIRISGFQKVDCEGDTVFWKVKTTGGSVRLSYAWTDSLGIDTISRSSTIRVSPDSVTMYVITVFDSCTNTLVKDTIYIAPIIPVDIKTINDTVVCAGTLLQLFANVTLPNPHFTWTATDLGLQPVGLFDDDTIPNPIFSVPTGVYEILITVTLTNEEACADPIEIRVSIIPKGIYGKKPAYVCLYDTAQLLAYGGVKYKWKPSTGLSNDTIANPRAWLTQSYTVDITDSIGCINQYSVSVKIDTLPKANAGPDRIVCRRSEVTLNAGGSDYGTYEWSPKNSLDDYKSATPKATPIATTTYILKAKNNACYSFDTMVVYVVDTPSAKFTIAVDTCERTIALQNNTIGTDSVFWNFGDTNYSTEANPIHKYKTAGNYTVKLIANRNTECIDSVEVNLVFPSDAEIKDIPNVFTPNGDNVNDKFVIAEGNVACNIESLYIYNRWGKLVYKQTGKNIQPWDGKHNGQALPAETYFYYIEGKGIKKTGTIAIVL